MGHRDPDVKHRVPKPIQPPAPKSDKEKKSEIKRVKPKQVYSKRMLFFE